MTVRDQNKIRSSGLTRPTPAAWLIGLVMLAIICAIASPFVMSFFGYGVRYSKAGVPGPLPHISDVFIVLGIVSTAWCTGWVAAKAIRRWTDRTARRPAGWIRFLLHVAGYASVLLLGYSLQMQEAYIEPVITGCAIMVMLMVAEACRDKREAS